MEIDGKANPSIFVASTKDDAAQKCAPAKNKLRPGKAIINFWIDAATFLTFLICTISGAALKCLPRGGNITEAGLLNKELFWGFPSYEWGNLHNLIGWISVVLVVIHISMHWRWIVRRIFGVLRTGRANGKKQKPQTDF